jgi:hypothetical protein
LHRRRLVKREGVVVEQLQRVLAHGDLIIHQAQLLFQRRDLPGERQLQHVRFIFRGWARKSLLDILPEFYLLAQLDLMVLGFKYFLFELLPRDLDEIHGAGIWALSIGVHRDDGDEELDQQIKRSIDGALLGNVAAVPPLSGWVSFAFFL